MLKAPSLETTDIEKVHRRDIVALARGRIQIFIYVTEICSVGKIFCRFYNIYCRFYNIYILTMA